jgi:hypothetical protein
MKIAMYIFFGIAALCFLPFVGSFIVGACYYFNEWRKEFFVKGGYKDPQQVMDAIMFIGCMCFLLGGMTCCLQEIEDKQPAQQEIQNEAQPRGNQEME